MGILDKIRKKQGLGVAEARKQLDREAEAKTAPVTTVEPAKAAPVKGDKSPKPRRCCASLKGKDVPHLPGCQTLAPRTPRKKTWRNDPNAMRLPNGAAYTGVYDAVKNEWKITLTATVNGQHGEWIGTGSNHDRTMHKLAEQCRVWAAEQAGTQP